MKLEIRVGVNFNKLASDMPKLIDKFVSDSFVGTSVKLSKEFIKSGKVKPKLKQSTIDIRKRGKYGGSTPLYESGALHDSLKKTKDGMEMVGYAPAHHSGHETGHFPPRPFIVIPKLKDIQKTLIESMKTSLHRKSPLVLKT
jgi:hypothetical protein